MRLVLFDLDNTLLAGDSDYEWGQFLIERGVVDREHHEARNHAFYEDYKAGRLDIYAFLNFSLRPLATHTRAQLDAWHAEYMTTRILPMMTAPARALVDKHLHDADLVAIITATNSFVAAPIAKAFGVQHLIATEPEQINGRFTGEVSGTPCFREGKITRLEQFLEHHGTRLDCLTSSRFYSDSLNDLPLLQKVQHPVAVDPDPTLHAHAAMHGWPVISLREPMPFEASVPSEMPARRNTLADGIVRQRKALQSLLRDTLAFAANACSEVWGDRQRLNEVLSRTLENLPSGKYLYALDTNAIQVSDTISRDGTMETDFGRDRASRPYMNERVPSAGFLLSQAYISLRTKRPSLTAIQVVRDSGGRVLGFVGADFDLRDLPITRELYAEPTYWRQIKGDPSIRGNVFRQTRTHSQMDTHIDTVLSVVEELMTEHGIFHGKLHFSSSRATIWLVDDPYRYRLLDIDALIHPDTCLSWPHHAYPPEALTPQHAIRPILEGLRKLRFMDETFYLRAGSINIFNGMVGLTFSCDGSHYLPWDEFLNKGYDFWANGKATGENRVQIDPSGELHHVPSHPRPHRPDC